MIDGNFDTAVIRKHYPLQSLGNIRNNMSAYFEI